MSIIPQIIAGLYVLAVTIAIFGAVYMLVADRTFKTTAEVNLLKSQAEHVDLTKQAEAANLKETIKAYEGQGVNKFRTEIARLGGDLGEIEKKLGSKIKAVSLAEHEAKLAALSPGGTTIPAEAILNCQSIPGAAFPV